MLRAGPFSDERVVRLANRRFVAFYFDLSNRGFAGDPDARAFVVEKKPEYGGNAVPTPKVLFMADDGRLLGEVSNYATARQVLAAMRRVLREHPEYDEPARDEAAGSLLERAQVRIDLQDPAGARELLQQAEGARAHYLRGRLARFDRDWERMHAQLAKVDDPDLAADVRMESAYEHWFARDWKKLAAALHDFPEKSRRYTEARYYEGLAFFHQRKVQKARAIWKATIEGRPEDPWIYRADWAYTNAKQKKRRTSFSSARRSGSLLGRIGYMGRPNPDLKGPRSK